ncbi:hypothetical protein QQS21_011689 [Conoideocrella luteorostrata]|uniref:Polyketide synthase n=1 Tax=Conoideocrella luteorostrata TaxID=1105319 RepID=A0AAJ0FTG3_9HYPO|nr:hypothetical protein QQS21_011689 [Conoideocrella luteorostrata]
MAIAGGSNLILYPSSSIGLSTVGLTGPNGTSFSFDARAEGYGRGEGVGCIILKLLSDAIRDNDPIRAVIRETGMNQDGFTPTITSPSSEAQQDLIRSCYERAGLDPLETTYTECHGTGTIAGDTIELTALGDIFSAGRSANDPLYVGSIKANFGHTEATSGIAAIIKVVQMLQNDAIPPQALFSQPNPRISFQTLNIKVPTSLIPWPDHRLRRVSVNNFGAGGSNTHAIIESAAYHVQPESRQIMAPKGPGYTHNGGTDTNGVNGNGVETSKCNGNIIAHTEGLDPACASLASSLDHNDSNVTRGGKGFNIDVADGQIDGNQRKQSNCTDDSQVSDEFELIDLDHHALHVNGGQIKCLQTESEILEGSTRCFLLPISAKHESGVQQVARSLKDYLDLFDCDDHKRMQDLIFTLSIRRSKLPWRTFVSAGSISDLQRSLENPNASGISATSSHVSRLGFVFTGQGAHWSGMGRELVAAYPVFRDTMLHAESYIQSLGAEWSVLDEISRDDTTSRLDQPFLSFPCTVIVQLALVNLLKAWGITPVAVTGHSSGEIAAAYAADYLSSEEAVAIAYWRGKTTFEYVQAGRIQGGMMAMGIGFEDAQSYLADLKTGSASVACVNSPRSVTIAGDVTALEEIEARATAKQIFNRRLKVPAAYHSSQMECLSDQYGKQLRRHLQDTRPCQGNILFASPVTGAIEKDHARIRSPTHWIRNMVQVVQFHDALTSLISSGIGNQTTVDVLIEIGPHGALQGPVRQILADPSLNLGKVTVDKTLERGKNAVQSMLDIAGRLFIKGFPMQFESINFPQGLQGLQVVTDLPLYPWDHTTSFSALSSRAKEALNRKQPPHDLLGVKSEQTGSWPQIWRNVIRTDNLPWLQHHKVQSEIIFPAAGMVTMAMDAMRQLDLEETRSSQGYRISDLELYNGVVVPSSSSGLDFRLVMQDQSEHILGTSNFKEFTFQSRDAEDNWKGHCSGKVENFDKTPEPTIDKSQSVSDLTPINIEQFYLLMQDVGPQFGPSFQNISFIAGGQNRAMAIITVPDIDPMLPDPYQSDYWIHPTVLDACLQVAWAAVPREVMDSLGTCVPRFVESIYVASHAKDLSPGAKIKVLAALDAVIHQEFQVSIHAFLQDEGETLIMQTEALRVCSLSPSTSSGAVDNTMILKPEWRGAETNLEDLLGWGVFNNRAASCDCETILLSLSTARNPSGDNETALAEAISNSTGAKVDVGRLGMQPIQGKVCVILETSKEQILSRLSAEDFALLKATLLKADGVLWVSQEDSSSAVSPEASVHIGLLRTLRQEEKSKKYVSLVVSTNDICFDQEAIKAICDTFRRTVGSSEQNDHNYEVFHKSGQNLSLAYEGDLSLNEEYAVLAGQRQARGTRPWSSDDYMCLTIQVPGMLDSLEFQQCDMATKCVPFANDMVEIVPRAFGVNFRDVLVAMGEMKENWMGFECAGYVSRAGSKVPQDMSVGSRVCCIMQTGHWGNIVRVPWTSVVPIPELMNFELAASIPMCFTTAYYSLVTVGQLEADEAVLIHAAAGGTGQAAITIAQSLGADVFATVGSEEKRAFLMETYKLPGDRIFSSRNADFRQQVMRATGGKGVDVVLNSLAGPLLQSSWECLAECGRLIELGKRDARRAKALQMGMFAKPASYIAVDIVQLGIHKPRALQRVFKKVMTMLDKKEILHRIPLLSYGMGDLKKTFRLLQSGKHIGKAVVNVEHDEEIQTILSRGNVVLRPDATYLIVGGVGGLGLEIAKWMSARGAKHVALMSRHAAVSDNALFRDEFRDRGTEIHFISCDVTNMDALAEAISTHPLRFPIQGVIQAAAVLRDTIFENMTHQQWLETLRPKVEGTRNLDKQFQQSSLDFFVILSSATAVVGNAGQANYTAGGTYQDALAQLRISLGLPAVSINLGAVLSAGLAARSGIASRLGKSGFRSHEISEVLRLVELAVRHPFYGQMVSGIKPWSSVGEFSWRLESRFEGLRIEGLRIEGDESATAESGEAAAASLKHRLSSMSETESTDVLVHELTSRLADIFGRQPSSFDVSASLSSYGVDSLVAVELRNWITSNVTSNASVFDITQSASITDLAKKLAIKYGQK